MTALVLLLLVPAADEAVQLTVRREQAGDKTSVVRTTATTLTLTTTGGGANETKKEVTGSTLQFAEDILVKPADADRPTRVSRTYEKASRKLGDKESDMPFAKKTVVFEKTPAGRFKFLADGEELTGDAAKLFEEEFNTPDATGPDQELLPPQPVKVGDTWEVSAELVAKRMTARGPFTVEPTGAKLTSKLVKLLERDGAKFAVVEQTIEIGPKALQQGGKPIPLDAGSKITTSVTWEFCRDGSRHDSNFTGKSKFDVGVKIPGGPELKMAGEGTTTRTTKPRK